VQAVINNFKAKRSPGYDLITGKILQELPPTAVKYLTPLFNAAMLLGYFPMQWKVETIILILKPGNPPPHILLAVSLAHYFTSFTSLIYQPLHHNDYSHL
jgi:hypothetical protein